MPHPTDDCTEEMSQLEFGALKVLCDGQESCEYENPGALLLSCVDPYLSNYLSVYYTCQSGIDLITCNYHPCRILHTPV